MSLLDDLFCGRNVIGVDPGSDGAFAGYCNGSFISRVMPMRKVETSKKGKYKNVIDRVKLHQTVKELVDCGVEAFFLERVSAQRGEGAVGAFSFGHRFGAVDAALGWAECQGVHVDWVWPSAWTRYVRHKLNSGLPFTASRGKKERKDAKQKAIIQAFGMLDLTASKRARKPHGGIVDALGIGMYGAHVLNTEKANGSIR